MPATSRAQRVAMAIAEHHPDQLNPANKGLLQMSHQQLHDFASTPEKGLPQHANAKTVYGGMNGKKRKPAYGQV